MGSFVCRDEYRDAGVATAELEGSARRSGRMQSMVAAGPFLGLVIGSVVDQLAGPSAAFLVLAAAPIVAFVFAIKLPRGRRATGTASRPAVSNAVRLDTWSFIQGMTLDGLFVIGA